MNNFFSLEEQGGGTTTRADGSSTAREGRRPGLTLAGIHRQGWKLADASLNLQTYEVGNACAKKAGELNPLHPAVHLHPTRGSACTTTTGVGRHL